MENISVNIIDLPHIVPLLGLALMSALFAGKIAKRIGLPKVTAYMMVGIILGPTGFNYLTEPIADKFHFINEIAFGLILFNIGGEFHRGLFENITLKHLKFSLVFSLLSVLFISCLCFLFTYFTDMQLNQRLMFSFYMAFVALAAAPPTTLLVIKEYNSNGPLTQSIFVFLIVSTVLALVGTEVLEVVYEYMGYWSGGGEQLIHHMLGLAWSFAGAVLFGMILGVLLSYWEQQEHNTSELYFAVICFIIFGITISHYLNLNPLFLSLALGFTLVNTSPTGIIVHQSIKEMGLSVFAIFFVLAGAHIHLQEQLQSLGILGLGYIIARTIGIFLSSKISSILTNEDEVVEKFLGPSVLSHAGAALAIVMSIKGRSEETAQTIVSVVMTSIFVFEIVGPLSLKFSLIKSKEAAAVMKTKNISKSFYGFYHLIKNFVRNINSGASKSDVKTVSSIVNHEIFAIQETATIVELTEFLKQRK